MMENRIKRVMSGILARLENTLGVVSSWRARGMGILPICFCFTGKMPVSRFERSGKCYPDWNRAGMFAVVGLLTGLAVGADDIQYYVAKNGNDGQSGSIDKPFATIERARDEVRKQGGGKNVTVWIRGGTYYLTKTIVLGPQDGGDESHTVTYSAYPGETPVLSSGIPVKGWKRPSTFPEGMSVEAQKHVVVASIPFGKGVRFSALYDQGGFLTRSSRLLANATCEKTTCTYDPVKSPWVRSWPNIGDCELRYQTWNWSMNYLPLQSIDTVKHIITFASYSAGTGKNAFIENIPEGMTGPGCWMNDTAAGLVYLWPKTDAVGDETVFAPALVELLVVQGDESKSTWVKNLVIRGLTFTHNDKLRFKPDRKVLIPMHDWVQYETPAAAVRLDGTEKCTVEDCTFRFLGSSGVRLDKHCMRDTVGHNHVQSLGGTGVEIVGYELDEENPRHGNDLNVVAFNHIHDVGRFLQFSPAIFLYQSGSNSIANNLIHGLPYSGIVLFGDRRPSIWERGDTSKWKTVLTSRENVIEHNEVCDVMNVLSDGNAIYLSATAPGNVVRRNYVHDVKRANGMVRTDDLEYDCTVEENVIWNGGDSGIFLKQVNYLMNNYIIDTKGSSVSMRNGSNHKNYPKLEKGVITRNIFYQSNKENVVYDGTQMYDKPDYPYQIDSNLVYVVGDQAAGDTVLATMRSKNRDKHSMAADPGFVDAAKGDFHLKANSPALALGIKPIDSWGLTGPVGPRDVKKSEIK